MMIDETMFGTCDFCDVPYNLAGDFLVNPDNGNHWHCDASETYYIRLNQTWYDTVKQIIQDICDRVYDVDIGDEQRYNDADVFAALMAFEAAE
jgi:hypothetical protein